MQFAAGPHDWTVPAGPEFKAVRVSVDQAQLPPVPDLGTIEVLFDSGGGLRAAFSGGTGTNPKTGEVDPYSRLIAPRPTLAYADGTEIPQNVTALTVTVTFRLPVETEVLIEVF